MREPIVVFVSVALAAACSSDPEGGRPAGPTGDGGGSLIDAGADAGDRGRGVSCSNGARDGDETDIDCGGSVCPPCANDQGCKEAKDCASLACTSGQCDDTIGCSDGTREGFAAKDAFPDIAACAGGWAVPGLVSTTAPACARGAGNDSGNTKGEGCNVADLCQPGWHVCATAEEVGKKSDGKGCAGAGIAGQSAFFVIRQSGPGEAKCGAGTNDLFGCGDVGVAPDAATCKTVDRFSNDLCSALPTTWACGADGANEAGNVAKPTSDNGGVLCCRD